MRITSVLSVQIKSVIKRIWNIRKVKIRNKVLGSKHHTLYIRFAVSRECAVRQCACACAARSHNTQHATCNSQKAKGKG